MVFDTRWLLYFGVEPASTASRMLTAGSTLEWPKGSNYLTSVQMLLSFVFFFFFHPASPSFLNRACACLLQIHGSNHPQFSRLIALPQFQVFMFAQPSERIHWFGCVITSKCTIAMWVPCIIDGAHGARFHRVLCWAGFAFKHIFRLRSFRQHFSFVLFIILCMLFMVLSLFLLKKIQPPDSFLFAQLANRTSKGPCCSLCSSPACCMIALRTLHLFYFSIYLLFN
jgi:hypothetical protein